MRPPGDLGFAWMCGEVCSEVNRSEQMLSGSRLAPTRHAVLASRSGETQGLLLPAEEVSDAPPARPVLYRYRHRVPARDGGSGSGRLGALVGREGRRATSRGAAAWTSWPYHAARRQADSTGSRHASGGSKARDAATLEDAPIAPPRQTRARRGARVPSGSRRTAVRSVPCCAPGGQEGPTT